jgi:prophage tail gpP-like protein
MKSEQDYHLKYLQVMADRFYEKDSGSSSQLEYRSDCLQQHYSSIADRVQEGINRDGYGLEISGRDLVGQLIDCSVPIIPSGNG